MKARKVLLNISAPAIPRDELVQLMARYVTGGDPAGYLARLAEKEAAEKAGAQTEENSPFAPECKAGKDGK